jgi:protein-disulfide isomerase
MNVMRFSRFAAVATAASVLIVGAVSVFVYRNVVTLGHRRPDRQPEEVRNWQTFASTGHRLGPEDATVVITEFCDFQCPFCRRESVILHRVQAQHPTTVAVVYRHFPLERRHPSAYRASLASECASAQGRFNDFHDQLFEHQGSWNSVGWTKMAVSAGVLDTSVFAQCIQHNTFAKAVRADVDAARKLGVSGTPTILVNGWRLHEPATEGRLEQLILAELGKVTQRD